MLSSKLTASCLLLLATSSSSLSAPFLVSDPYPTALTPKPTHCGLYLDATAKVETPVTTGAEGPYCKFDLATVTTGNHTAKATFILKDSAWGVLESAQSSPFDFAGPAIPSAPTGLILTP